MPSTAFSQATGASPRSDEADGHKTEPAPARATTTVGGFVDAAFHVDFRTPDVNSEQLAPFVQYTPPGNTFVLHAAHLALTHAFSDQVSATVELDAGYDATKTSAYPFNGSFFDVQEAFATYRTGPVTVTAGKFAGYEGSESIEGPTNPTITRGLSFNLAEPNTHTGVKVHYTSGAVDVGVGVVNGWDVLVDNNAMKTIVAKIGFTNHALTINLNGTFGSETENVSDAQRLSLDLNGVWTLTDHFGLRFQLNYGTDGIGGDAPVVRWYVFGVEPEYAGDWFTFGGRAEFFRDPDGARAHLGDVSMFNITLVPGAILARDFRVRCEIRTDIASENVFGWNDEPTRLRLSAALAAAYVF
jgi:hypothetical protein